MGTAPTAPSARSDEELIASVAAGDRESLRLLHERHHAWLTARLRRRCANDDIVADAVQDTFVAVWRNAQRYSAAGDVGAWIWGIAIHRLIGRLRKRSWPLATIAPRDATVASAEEHVLRGVEHGDLAGALNRLSPELRAVVEATVLDGLTTREAAVLLRIPAGTVKTRMMRAKIQLRGELA